MQERPPDKPPLPSSIYKGRLDLPQKNWSSHPPYLLAHISLPPSVLELSQKNPFKSMSQFIYFASIVALLYFWHVELHRSTCGQIQPPRATYLFQDQHPCSSSQILEPKDKCGLLEQCMGSWSSCWLLKSPYCLMAVAPSTATATFC